MESMSVPSMNLGAVDGRYRKTTDPLRSFFSEYALFHYRTQVELEYLLQLGETLKLSSIVENKKEIQQVFEQFSRADVRAIQKHEEKTKHDVKALELFLRDKLRPILAPRDLEMIHFGLTSQDINNIAHPWALKNALRVVLFPKLEEILRKLGNLAEMWYTIPMLARTHGQPATPTTLGKEMDVFRVRFETQLTWIKKIPIHGKFGGATGALNAHVVAYPHINWNEFADRFLDYLGLVRSYPTTQIEHYDQFAALCDAFRRVNVILIDCNRDLWTYISLNYFHLQHRTQEEIGSSTMPHKVNPKDFENSEGNLGLANNLFDHFSQKLPISRLQRDLSDSTVLRNIGVAFGYCLVAYESFLIGLSKLTVNYDWIEKDLDEHWEVLAEAVQSVLRREGIPEAYNLVKALVPDVHSVTQKDYLELVDRLPSSVSEEVRAELKTLTPHTYLGVLGLTSGVKKK